MKCSICEAEPGSHSLREIGVKDGVVIFYTCPAEASRYNDYDGIMRHYEDTFEDRIGDGTPWIWVFDCKGFTLKHLVEINVAIGIVSLISSRFSDNLQKVVVVNPYWIVHLTMNLLKPFMSEALRLKIAIANRSENESYLPA
jgi:Divergent CRAL/TRIO domain